MRVVLIFCYLFSFIHLCNAQQLVPVDEKKYVDSLSVVLRSAVSDSIKANTHYLLSDFYRIKDTIQSKKHLISGQQLSMQYPYLKAAYFFYEGQFYSNKKKEKAAVAFKNAIEKLSRFSTESAYLLQAASWYNYGIVVKDKEGYSVVIDILTKNVIPLVEKSKNIERQSHYYSQFGTILMYSGRFEEAISYHQKAIDLLKKDFPTSSALVLAYIGAANNLIYADKKVLAKKHLDAAELVLKTYPESANYPFYYLGKSLYYISTSEFDQALISAEKGIVTAQKNNQKEVLQLLLFRKYEVYLHQQKYTQAKKVLTDVLKEGVIIKDIQNKKAIYNELVKINELLGNKEEAFSWLKKYSALNDSLSGARLQETVAELEAQYKNAVGQKKITALEKTQAENLLEANKNKQFLLVLSGVSLVLLLVSVFSLVYYRNYKKLVQQKEINNEQQAKKRKQQEQLKITQAVLAGEERERGRVAQELHDGLGGMLTGVKINLAGWASLNLRPEERENLNKIIGQLDGSISELRGVAKNLMPESLLRFGLETALKDLCIFYSSTQIVVDYQLYNVKKDIVLPVQLHIYRIIQELISNAVKHADSSSILLQCTQEEDVFLITIEDNGKGFVLEEQKQNGIGLLNVQNRVQYLRGKMEVISTPLDGTTINIELNLSGDV